MEKVVFRERIIPQEPQENISISYSETRNYSKVLDWSQVFYLSHSFIITKVFGSCLQVSHYYFSSTDLSAVSSQACLDIHFPGNVRQNLYLSYYASYPQLFIPVAPNQLYELTFNCPISIKKSSPFSKMKKYEITQKTILAFSFIQEDEKEFEVVFGLTDGSLLLAWFSKTENEETIKPNKTRVIGVPMSPIRRVKSIIFRSAVCEKVMRTSVISGHMIASLNNIGGLRLYDLVQQRFVSDLQLEIPEEYEYKFCCFSSNLGSFLALGYYHEEKSWVYLIKIENLSFKIESVFVEKGILFDIGVNKDGLWIACGNFDESFIKVKPFDSEIGIVYSYFDEKLTQDLLDRTQFSKSRILEPDRFTNDEIFGAFSKELKDRKLTFEIIENTQVDPETGKKILDELKLLDIQSKEIWALGVSDRVGEFPVVVIRGNNRIGVIRKIVNLVESCDVEIKSISAHWSGILALDELKNFSKFKLSCCVNGLDLALVIIRIWRQGLTVFDYLNFTEYLLETSKKEIPGHILQILKRLVQRDLNDSLLEIFQKFSENFTESFEKKVSNDNEFWPSFTVKLLSSNLVSMVKSHFDYFCDISLFLMIIKTYFPEFLISQQVLNNYLISANFLNLLNGLLSSPVFINNRTSSISSFLSAPITVSSLYIYSRSDLLLGSTHSFNTSNFSIWVNNSLALAVRDLCNLVNEGPSTRNPFQKLSVFENSFRICPQNLFNLLSHYGQAELLYRHISSVDYNDSINYYFLGKSLINLGETAKGNYFLIKSHTAFVSGNEDFNHNQLLACPLETPPPLFTDQRYSLYFGALMNSLKKSEKFEIILSDFFVKTFYLTFHSEMTQICAEALVDSFGYREALSVIQGHPNKKIKTNVLELVIEKSVKENRFKEFLDIPLLDLNKKLSFKNLKKRSLEEEFRVKDFVFKKKYWDDARVLFLENFRDESREEDLNDGITWSEALYLFCMRNFMYAKAAGASFRIFLRIESHCFGLEKGSKELIFLQKILTEYLLMTRLASRNIDRDIEKCWFLVSEKNGDEEVRRAISFYDLDKYFNKYIID